MNTKRKVLCLLLVLAIAAPIFVSQLVNISALENTEEESNIIHYGEQTISYETTVGVELSTEELKLNIAEIHINAAFNDFMGNATFSVYEQDGTLIDEETVYTDSEVIFKVPSDRIVDLYCVIGGEGASYTTQNFTHVNQLFSEEHYDLNVEFDYNYVCTHTNTREELVESTYTNSGFSKITCVDCGEVISEKTIEKKVCNHSQVVQTTTKEATEYENGAINETCAECNAFLGTKEVKAYGHTHNYKIIIQDATCTEKGYEYQTCQGCGDTVQVREIPMKEHNWDNGTVINKLSCETDGKTKYVCKTCGAVEIETVACEGHDYKVEHVSLPTCKKEGTDKQICTKCGKTNTKLVPKTNTHNPETQYTVVREATCGTAGLKQIKCKDCRTVIKEVEIPATGNHNYYWFVKTEATTTSTGVKEYKCTSCGHVKNTETIAKVVNNCDHLWTEKKVEKQKVSTTQDGIIEVYCSHCNELKRTETVHKYQAYTVDIGGGKTQTVYGYFDDAAAKRVYDIINSERTKAGVKTLYYNNALQQAANTRAFEQMANYSHTRPNGSQWYSISSLAKGENLANGAATTSPDRIMAVWMNSTGHRENILRSNFTNVSVACFHAYSFNGTAVPYEQTFWVQLFGRG